METLSNPPAASAASSSRATLTSSSDTGADRIVVDCIGEAVNRLLSCKIMPRTGILFLWYGTACGNGTMSATDTTSAHKPSRR